MTSWYVQQGDQRLGPMTLDELKAKAASGQIAATDLVWGEGMATWEPASSQSWFQGPTSMAPLPPPNPQWGNLFRGEDYVESPPPSLIGWSIAVLLCCCLPGGIVGLIYGSRANSQFAKGNYAEARSAYETGKNWLIGSAIVSGIINIIYLISKTAH